MAQEPGVGDARPSVRRLLTNRHRYGVYVLGAGLSNLGTWCQTLAGVLLVYRLTGSTLFVGLASVCQFAWPIVLGPWAGLLADRVERRRLLVVVQLAAAAVSGTLAALTLTGTVRIGHALAAIALLGVLQAFQAPAQVALVPLLASAQERELALSLSSSQFNVARALGPVLASGLVVVGGPGLPFLVNSASFLLYVGLIVATRPAPQPMPTMPPRLRDTLTAVTGHPALLPLFAIGFVTSGSTDVVTTLGPALSVQLTGGDDWTGWLVTAFGGGATVAAIWLVPLLRRVRRRLPWTICVEAVGFVVLALAPNPAAALTGAVLVGVGFLLSVNRSLYAVHTLVAPELVGRVSAVWLMAFLGGRACYALAAGAVAQGWGPRAVLLLVAVTVVAAAVGARFLPVRD